MAGQPISQAEQARLRALNNATTAKGVTSNVTPQNQAILSAVNAQTQRQPGAQQAFLGAAGGNVFSQSTAAPATTSAGPVSAPLAAVRNAVAGAGQAIQGAAQSPAVQQYAADWKAANTAPPIGTMLQQPAALGSQFQASGQAIQNQTQSQANNLIRSAGAGGITSQNVAAGSPVQQAQAAVGAAPGAPARPGLPGAAGGSTYIGGGQQNSLTPMGPGGGGAAPVQSNPGSFQVGQQLPTGPAPTAPGNVAGNLGPVRDVTGAQSVANQLGLGPQVGNVGGITNQLGAAPQVGNVGNIAAGAAPGSVTPQLGNFGQQNAAQQGMLGRVENFLDAPQGPSIAEAQLQQTQADNMGALIGAARSGRGGAGAQAQALRGAQSEGSAVMSDTAGQLATLRAQEEDMRKNRDLSAIGLGGNLATAQRQQDLGFRGQDLSALQGDQSTSLGARGQDLTASLANQSTQTALEGLRAQTALGARGQNLSALQGDQGTALGLEGLRAQTGVATRGQDLSALGMDAGNQLAAQQLGVQRDLGVSGQNLAALQGDQQTQLGFQGLGVQRELGLRGQDVATRAQDLGALTSDADRNLAAQGLGVQRELGLTNAGLTAQGQGLQYLSNTNQQQLGAQAATNDLYNGYENRGVAINGQNLNYSLGVLANQNQPSWGEQLLGNTLNIAGPILGGVIGGPAGAAAGGQVSQQVVPKTGITQGSPTGVGYDSNQYPYEISDERAKTDITPLAAVKAAAESPISDLHRQAKGYQYRYKLGIGQDPDTVHWGPMAQDLEKSPIGRSLVKTLPTGLKVVDANRLTMTNHAALSEMRSELDGLRKLLRAS